MPLGYVIPGARKYIHQGPTVQDSIPVPAKPDVRAQIQHYDNAANANRYIRVVKPELHQVKVNLDLYIPKFKTPPYPSTDYRIPSVKFIDQPIVAGNQDVFEPKQNYPYPVIYPIRSGSEYIDVGPSVQSGQHVFGFRSNPYPYQLVTYPIPPLTRYVDQGPQVQSSQHVFGFRSNPYPYQLVTYPIPPLTKYIDQGPQVQSGQHVFGFKANSTYPVVYPVGSVSKFIDVASVVSQDVFLKKAPYYPTIPYQIPPSSKLIQVPPYTNQQTYIFPLPKPIQEWYNREYWLKHVRKVNHILDNITAITSGNALLACVDTAISWSNHFASRGWTDIQDQITAGYPIYVEPALTTGTYQEVFDFGSIISNIIAIVNWNEVNVVGSVATSSTTLETSTDNVTWSAPTVGTSVFATALRYVRLTMNFVSADDKSLAIYSNLQCILNVHREQDGGQANVFAADVGGTVVTFNKAFKAIDALTITPLSTTEQKAVYDFAFPPNPTTFKVLLFNAAGARVDGLITWVARGIF